MFGIATRFRKRAVLVHVRNFVLAQNTGDYETEVMKDIEQGFEVKYRLEFHRNGTVLLARQKEGKTTWFRPQDEVFKKWIRKVHIDLLIHKTNTKKLHLSPSRVPLPRAA